MTIKHWMTAELLGANGSFQRAAREYAEEYAAMAVLAERKRIEQWVRNSYQDHNIASLCYGILGRLNTKPNG